MLKTLYSSLMAELSAVETFNNSKIILQKTLNKMTKKVSKTAFGKFYGLQSNMSINEFRTTLPIQSYVDYEPWIDRIKSGETNVLWPGRPFCFVTTSGTTSIDKFIPITKEFINDYHKASLLTFHRMLLKVPSLLFGKILTLGGPSEEYLCNNIPVGSISGVLYSTLPNVISSHLAVPPKVHNIRSYEEKLYVLARLALEKSIIGIITAIPGSLLVFLDAINDMAEELIKEISDGTLRRLSTAPPGLEEQIRSRMEPNQKRALELENAIHKDDRLLPRQIWPIRALCSYMKDGHKSQWDVIYNSYGNLITIDPGLVASEGRVSVGLQPGKTNHAVLPFSTFVEFLPVDSYELGVKTSKTSTLLPNELQEGELYTPIISSTNGLLRYCVGDEVKVTHKRKGIPFIEYMGRLDHTISAAGEKVSDAHIRDVICSLQRKGVAINGLWAVGIDWSMIKPRYVLLWETERFSSNPEIEFDQLLKTVNVSYRRKREQLLLLPALIKQVRQGELPIYSNKYQWIGQAKQQFIYPEKSEVIEKILTRREDH